ncbi:MAG TPA: MDR family MFS transporter [Candidatus Dormibacteraeota bacterium]|nr:MDR family MFS transporter [Candidatus Dormibacteraeota bacterium]
MTDTLTTETVAEQVAPAPSGPPTRPPAEPEPTNAIARRVLARVDYGWAALAVVLGGTIMTILDATVVNVAIKTLQDAFNAHSYTDIAWVVTGYSLAQGAVIPITGWATDRFGTKRLYLISLFSFVAASAACGLAWSLPVLIVFRILQGLGGGMLMPIGLTIILQAFGPSRMGRVMGYFGVPMLIAPALGPVIGGWFAQDYSWRLIFFINVPIGILAFGAAYFLLRETPTSRTFKLDAVGLLTAVPAVVALMYAMDRASSSSWGDPVVVTLLVAAAALFVAFVIRQRTTDQPLLQLRLFRDSTFSWSIVLGFLLITGLFGTGFLLPTFLQSVHGYGALETGLVLLPQALTAAVFMPFSGRLTDRIGPKPLVMTGVVLLTIGLFALSHIDASTSIPAIGVCLALIGVAMAFGMMPGMTAGLARIPRDLTSRASSITNTAQRVGMSIGIALLVTFLSSQTGSAAAAATCAPSDAVVAEAQTALPAHPATAAALCDALRSRAGSAGSGQGGSGGPASTGHADLDAFITSYGHDATSIAFDRTFLFMAIVAALGLVPAYFLRRPERQPDGQAAPAAALVEA